jgi:3-oxoacyl-(acyl-carrier-protein) synthase
MALFSQYAVAAAQEAIEDAGLQDMTEDERENVVR